MRWQRGGYTDLGPIQIPPMPTAIVLTDRANGSLWLLSFNPTSNHLSINNDFATIRNREGVVIYDGTAGVGPAFDESGEFRIFIRNGHIGLEYIPFAQRVTAFDNAPPYARTNADKRQMKITTTNIATAKIGYII